MIYILTIKMVKNIEKKLNLGKHSILPLKKIISHFKQATVINVKTLTEIQSIHFLHK